MLSQGQLIFAILFIIFFTILIVLAYKKDKKLHKKNYKGVIWVLISFIIFVGILVMTKYLLRNYA
ncbi:hypothetical protein [Allomuricauda sp. d1]|uniref:hypothetical protein n=1 Tax=Allomuricauda sp. d1 TaxID=3136725 RepID=UPI0031E088B6